MRNFFDIEEKYRFIGIRLFNGFRSGRLFLFVNVFGMVFYFEDDSEEIDKIVENVFDLFFKEEKVKL